MSFSPDPRKTGWLPSSQDGNPDENFQPKTSSSLSTSQPSRDLADDITVPLNKLTQQSRASRLKKPMIWSIVSVVVLLCIVLGFILKNGQSGNAALVPGAHPSATTSSQPTQSSTPALTPGSYTSTNSRLFSNSSPWNVPIGTNVQLDPHSSGMISQLTPCCHVPTLYRFGMPIYTSTASDPTYTVKDTGNDSLFESHQPIRIPDIAAPSPGSDHWLFIFDKTQNLIFEMWNTHKSGNTWTTQTGDVYSPTGDGVLQVDGSQQSGNGASYFGGVVTDADIQRGYINHALSFAASDTANTWRYPMNASDGNSTDSSALPMGARLQLDPSVNCNTLAGASAGEKMVCQALETYGGYIRDSGGVTLSMYFEGEDLNDPNRNPPSGSPGNTGRSGGVFNKVGLQDGKDLSDIPWDKMRVLKAWNSYTPLSSTQSSVAPAHSPLSLTSIAPAATTRKILNSGYFSLTNENDHKRGSPIPAQNRLALPKE